MKINIAEMAGIEKAISYSQKYKCGIEIQRFGNGSLLDSDKLVSIIESIKKLTKDIAVLSVHGPFCELVPSSSDKRIRDIVHLRFNQIYKIAEELRAKHLILHSGFIPKTCLPKVWLENSVNFWNRFLANKDNKIKIHIENVYENNFALLDSLINSINLNYVDICLDIGHVNSNSELNVEQWIKGLNNKIGYIHLHNNFGILDDHFSLDKGNINMLEVFKLIDEYCSNAIKTLETFEIDSTIKWLAENIMLN
jgi:sugar phosphate isomerase/epimerase